MRSVVLLGLLMLASPSRSAACEYDDAAFVFESARTLPSHPSLFIHVNWHISRLPTFTQADGTPVAYRMRIDFLRPHGVIVDLDIDRGVLLVQAAYGRTWTFDIDPFMRPRTRSIYTFDHGLSGIRWNDTWFEVDSDADWFRIDDANGSHYELVAVGNRIRGDFTTHNRAARITALYPDGTEELILDFHPPEDESWPWATFALAAAAAVIAKFAQHE